MLSAGIHIFVLIRTVNIQWLTYILVVDYHILLIVLLLLFMLKYGLMIWRDFDFKVMIENKNIFNNGKVVIPFVNVIDYYKEVIKNE